MHVLIVTAHPESQSLTHSIAARVAKGIVLGDSASVVEVANLAQEAFNPCFTEADLQVLTLPPRNVSLNPASGLSI
ncbi:NAD(P)H-dependent oxidoreductase [Pseudomonas syringae]|uniref:NAD(P)H-dependent oxidoreductase n=1 Tax=Pseudomonas syringae TaxID=317 RepID=UPI0032D8FBA3